VTLVLANVLQPLVDLNEAILKFFHDDVGFSWGWSIVALTVVIRLAILPLTYRQVRGMQQMQRLAPEMKKIQERFKDDKQRQQQELMKFYQDHGFNPLSSCLPLLLQLPFFISLYQLQRSASFKEDVGGDGFLFIPHLTEKATGGALAALIILYIATQLGSSLVTMVNVQDKNQKRLFLALPFFFTLLIINFPAGLIVYWITTNLWTVGQQLAVRRFLPAPEPLDTSKGAKGDADAEPPKKRREGIFARAAAAQADREQARGGDAKASSGSDGKASGKPARGGAKQSSGKSSSGKA
jgi:YidC/Oxa1 family membrane protein insertase